MYKLNDIFYLDDEYSSRAEFCNNNGLMIVEIEADKHGRRFQIQEVPTPTQQELNEQKIWELKQKLAETDYQVIKFAEGELSETTYEKIKSQRRMWRKEINQMEEKKEYE